MSGEPERYSRYPEVGLFYAMREPLCLAQITAVSTTGLGNGPTSVLLNAWTPTSDKEELSFIDLRADMADYLWHSEEIELGSGHYAGWKIDAVAGDVYLATMINRLWFAGPKTTSKMLHVIANFHVSESDLLMAVLYQQGAGHRRPRCKTAFEHILEDAT